MVAPWRKGWFFPTRVGGVLTNGPGPSRPGNCAGVVAGEGKGADALVGGEEGEDRNEAEVWSRFREAGFLHETVLHTREMKALAERISELEKELYQYQYHMGLLLIEKKNMITKYEKLRQEMSDEVEIKKRMQAAHIVSISEFEKREENMRRGMGFQRQTIVNLEKALSEMHEQTAEVKLEYLKKLSEAHTLEATAEDKNSKTKGKLHSLDSTLAEVGQKSTEIDRRLQEVEARELKLHKASSFITEMVASEKDVAQQKQDLHALEKESKDNQKRRMAEWHSLQSEREIEAHGRDSILKKKEKQLDEVLKTLEISKDSIKLKDEDICAGLRILDAKEKDVIVKQGILDKKETELIAIREQLSNWERVDVQKTTDYHSSILESQWNEFELETQNKGRDVDEQLEGRIDVIVHKKIMIENREREIFKKERDLERDMRKLKDKEEENGMIMTALTETITNKKELRKERIKHEKEWELFSEKRSSLEEGLKQLSDEKEKYDQWRSAEDEGLSKNNMEMSGYIHMDQEGSALNMFIDKASHLKINASEVSDSETALVADDIDVYNMQKNREQVNRILQEDIDCNRRSNITNSTCITLNNIDESKMLCTREQECELKKGKTKVTGSNNEVRQASPIILNYHDKDQIDKPPNESELFLGSAEELMSCRNCRFKDRADEILLVESTEVSEQGTSPGPAKPETHLLCMQRCSRLMEFSPDKRAAEHSDKSDCLDGETLEHEEVNTSQWVQSASGTQYNREQGKLNKDENTAKVSLGIPYNSTNIFKLNDSPRDMEYLALPPGLDSVSLPLRRKQCDHRGRRRSVFVKKSRSVNALIADDNLEEISQNNHDEGSTPKEAKLIRTCLDEGYSYNGDQEAVRCLSFKQAITSTGRGEYAVGHPEDILLLGNSSEMEISPGTEILGLKRYNYRQSTIARVAQALACRIKRKKEEEFEQPLENKVLKVAGNDDGEGAQWHTSAGEDLMHQ